MTNFIAILGFIIGILGLIATLVGTYFTYISFINPITRFKRYLKNHEDWEKFYGIEDRFSFYRHRKYPNFQIIIDWSQKVAENFHEEWINDALYPDKTNNASYYVRLEANSMLLGKELFVSLDGHRYFVPVPRVLSIKNGERRFYYDKQQIQLTKIIGKHHFEKDIYEFAKECKKPIVVKE
ncbi:MAG: hypothetical protein HYT36_02780 [Candidatus Staskawiczbacteria bacterium]|nr:hypothetical protein [Candidatus Staskawiczbacteria bacterium]